MSYNHKILGNKDKKIKNMKKLNFFLKYATLSENSPFKAIKIKHG